MLSYNPKKIRNFSIIAHIDHGKSTLSDRIIQACGAVSERKIKEQMLDSMPIERERGITIKAQTVRLHYKGYNLNLIDTPGHVDFSYEVSRSLAACEGSILLVDATQGMEAQTLANAYHAINNNHEILVVLNKIDLPAANIEEVTEQIEQVLGIDASQAIPVSAKTGEGVDVLLDAIIDRLPPPSEIDYQNHQLMGLVIDSWYDNYLGFMALLRIKTGILSSKDLVKILSNGKEIIIDEVGVFEPEKRIVKSLKAGEIGFVTTGIKNLSDCRVGDTIASIKADKKDALPGFSPPRPMVFCGLFPESSDSFQELRDAIERLHLNDPGFEYSMESSDALGQGFRCGFLGLLHLEIILDRIEREFDIDIITTAPGVEYKILLKDGSRIMLHNPGDMPDPMMIESCEEPYVRVEIMLPDDKIGAVMNLCMERRGENVLLEHTGKKPIMRCEIPLSEIIFDFHDRLKSISSGYASLNWDLIGFRQSKIVKMLIMINGERADALSCILHADKAEQRGRAICAKLKDLIPRQMFKIPVQAAIGGKIIARETVSPVRKDVTAKCYGRDVSRKKKLLEKQKKGKKRMSEIGDIKIPKNAFIEALKTSGGSVSE